MGSGVRVGYGVWGMGSGVRGQGGVWGKGVDSRAGVE